MAGSARQQLFANALEKGLDWSCASTNPPVSELSEKINKEQRRVLLQEADFARSSPQQVGALGSGCMLDFDCDLELMNSQINV